MFFPYSIFRFMNMKNILNLLEFLIKHFAATERQSQHNTRTQCTDLTVSMTKSTSAMPDMGFTDLPWINLNNSENGNALYQV